VACQTAFDTASQAVRITCQVLRLEQAWAIFTRRGVLAFSTFHTVRDNGRHSVDQHVIILVLYLVNRLPLDGRTRQIAQIVVIIIGIISLLKYLAVF
jgi:hypothetical protein